jgi:hypothetical protein
MMDFRFGVNDEDMLERDSGSSISNGIIFSISKAANKRIVLLRE